jgi:hypothetical protein
MIPPLYEYTAGLYIGPHNPALDFNMPFERWEHFGFPSPFNFDTMPIDGDGWVINAHWTPAPRATVDDNDVVGAIDRVNDPGPTEYTLLLDTSVTVPPNTLNLNRAGTRLEIYGLGANRTISLGSAGAMFTVGTGGIGGEGITLVLGNRITLQGRSDNNAPLVRVNQGCTFTMFDGSTIADNTNTNRSAGGVYVSDGMFNMQGGIIRNNAGGIVGGVYLVAATPTGSIFFMTGGSIHNNDGTSDVPTGTDAGGIFLDTGNVRFIKTGGTIYGNSANYGPAQIFWNRTTAALLQRIAPLGANDNISTDDPIAGWVPFP